ncbi:unnamed protein product [Didymodactylos carnosus]|uniref:Uncharacterized protein n=1 Tax=Didymodactylos carnosus TaxID=1234261 RepID=A0A815EPA6_9BILA|nr:unnamed protein product [Didymodactylos carnosus]CAF1314789.1 unnamed protein product [Didymodactylos carnosus]CAF4002475.1 unnamed protein product [Didymodactylos carnosus]CAF4155441.1 unnamed protein product [Didymodactylos carnosus]
MFSFLVIEHTLDQNRSYKDCIIAPDIDTDIDDHLFYCLRRDDLFGESPSNRCYADVQITFKELSASNISTCDLLQWHVPVDLADFYGAILSNDSDNDIGNHSERCLDYRDICDGEFDTINGEDEFYCDQIETNICANNQFRCWNGLCIDHQFLFDGQGDCTDLSDEQNLLIHHKHVNFQACYKQASFDCDEHWCGRKMISCGDGECIPWSQRFWNEYDCHNYYTH